MKKTVRAQQKAAATRIKRELRQFLRLLAGLQEATEQAICDLSKSVEPKR